MLTPKILPHFKWTRISCSFKTNLTPLLLLSIIIILYSSKVCLAQATVLTYDDFENGWGNYSDGGNDCSLYTRGTYAHQGSRAANIQDNSGTASSFYHTNSIDVETPGYTEIKVEFYFLARSMDNSNEDFQVQYYDGSSWNTVANYAQGIDFNNNQFYSETVLISESQYTFPTNMKIRFQCDASRNNDDVYIDEVIVSASTNP